MNQKIKNQSEKKVIIKGSCGSHCIDAGQITHLTCMGYKTSFHLKDNAKLISHSKLLKKWEAELSDFGFLRVSKNTIINLIFLIYIESKERKVKLSSGEVINVSHEGLKLLNNIFKKTKNKP